MACIARRTAFTVDRDKESNVTRILIISISLNSLY